MHPSSPDLASELDRVRAGDEAAAQALVSRLNPLVMKIVRAHLPRRMAVEDLAQEIFARLFDRLPRYEAREGIPFEHWASRLAVRTCLDALRSERRRPEVRFSELAEGEERWIEYLGGAGDDAPTGNARDAREIVQKLLEALSPEDRLVVSLLDLEGKTAQEISEWTGWSRVGVRVRAFRARRRLRRAAEDFQQRGEL